MSDRPSQKPTGKVRPLEIPKAPRAPQVERSAISDGSIDVVHEEAPPASVASVPTSPPPPVFSELQRLSARPSPVPPPSTREEPRGHDSRSFTLPGPYAVPRLLVDAGDLTWFDVAEESRGLVALIDGIRSVADIAKERGIPQREAQLRIADLRARGVVEI